MQRPEELPIKVICLVRIQCIGIAIAVVKAHMQSVANLRLQIGEIGIFLYCLINAHRPVINMINGVIMGIVG